jgi:eukaryotic-like serine/threonine-protein kinase
VHRDLKPENMFYADEKHNKVVLIDLGSSDDLLQPELRKTFIDDNYKRSQHIHFVGTSQYMAPECARTKPTAKASDVWSMGIILFQLYTGLCPFRGASDYLIFKLSLDLNFLKFEDYHESILPQEAKGLIK